MRELLLYQVIKRMDIWVRGCRRGARIPAFFIGAQTEPLAAGEEERRQRMVTYSALGITTAVTTALWNLVMVVEVRRRLEIRPTVFSLVLKGGGVGTR
jgi:hypothetical protein